MKKYCDIFLSYSSQDKKFVDSLHKRLVNRGKYKIWYDDTHIFMGNDNDNTFCNIPHRPRAPLSDMWSKRAPTSL
jgi:hypothetical protein